MNVTHTSILRTLRDDPNEVEKYLLSVMTAEDAQRAREEEKRERARIAQEQAALDAARVRVTGDGGASIIDRMMTDQCSYKRRWGLALLQTRNAHPEDKDKVFRRYVADLFPFTADTPSALCGSEAA